jgi:Tol biopolymer transport system component
MGSQGDNPQRVLALAENEFLGSVHWSPDGQRLAYNRGRRTSAWLGQIVAIETCNLKGANRTAVASDPDLPLGDFCWLPDERIIFARQESRLSFFDGNLWEIGIDGRTGLPIGKPKRITQWAGSFLESLSASADGKRLTFLKGTGQGQVYVGELAAGGTSLSPPRRLRNQETYDRAWAWTADSKAVLFDSERNGTWGIFKQGLSQETAEPVVTEPRSTAVPRLSADGAWILYYEVPKTASTPGRLMRNPVSGGVPQPVLETSPKGLPDECARAPANLCVVSEESQDEKHLIVTAFDPLKGRGKVLRTIEKEPSAHSFGLALSPDGSTFAISKSGEAEIHISLLSLSGSPDREITVKGWPNLSWNGLEWSPNGRGFYCGSMSPQVSTLLYVDLEGNARVLWQHKGEPDFIWGIPSPDGRYIAIEGFSFNSNVWMLENF